MLMVKTAQVSRRSGHDHEIVNSVSGATHLLMKDVWRAGFVPIITALGAQAHAAERLDQNVHSSARMSSSLKEASVTASFGEEIGVWATEGTLEAYGEGSVEDGPTRLTRLVRNWQTAKHAPAGMRTHIAGEHRGVQLMKSCDGER